MSQIKEYLKDRLPTAFVSRLQHRNCVFHAIKRCLFYDQQDSTRYWKSRALRTDQNHVLWDNEEYNQLYRRFQQSTLEEYVRSLRSGSRVLDIGCGTGVVAKMVISMNTTVIVDAVDFPEMIALARIHSPSDRINYLACSAEEYFDASKVYHLIISSACFSMIRDITAMQKAMTNCLQMLDTGSFLIMMDPFHIMPLLARVRFGSYQVIRFMKKHGAFLTRKSGALFWPYREWLAMSKYRGETLHRRFHQGERLLTLLGQHFWADYKILIFQKGTTG